MFLLVPAHPGFPGQIPQSRKMVVCVRVFPYSMVSKMFLYSSAFKAKLCTNSDIHKHDITSDRQTKKPNIFGHQTWYGDTGPQACSSNSKTFAQFCSYGALKICRKPDTLTLKLPQLYNPSKSIQIVASDAF